MIQPSVQLELYKFPAKETHSFLLTVFYCKLGYQFVYLSCFQVLFDYICRVQHRICQPKPFDFVDQLLKLIAKTS